MDDNNKKIDKYEEIKEFGNKIDGVSKLLKIIIILILIPFIVVFVLIIHEYINKFINLF